MSLRYAVLTLLALIIIILLASKAYRTWTEPTDVPVGKEALRKAPTKVGISPIMQAKKELPDTSSNKIVSERNIFSPERKDFPVQSGPEGKKPVARPQIILNGVTIAADYESASVINPGRALRKGERETLTLRTGDKIGEYRLAKVLPDRIVFEATEDSFEVLLHNPSKPKQRIHAKTETRPVATASALPAPSVAPATPPALPAVTSSQQAATPEEFVPQTAVQPRVSRIPSATPYPVPTLRSRSIPTAASMPQSPATPVGPPGAFTQPQNY